MQLRGTNATEIGADALIQREQVSGNRPSNRSALSTDLDLLGIQLFVCGGYLACQLVALGFDLCAIRGEGRHSGLRTFGPLHDLQLDVFEVPVPPRERLQLMLQALQLLGVADGSRVQQMLIASLALAHLLDIGLGSCEVELEVRDDGLGRDEFVAQPPQASLRVGQCERLGNRRTSMGDLRQARVLLLQFEQVKLVGGFDVQDALPR